MPYYRGLEHVSSFRKLAAAVWRAPNNPSILGSVDIDMSAAHAFLEAYNRQHGCKCTVTHLVVRALALTLGKAPECNVKVSGGRFRVRSQVDIFCQIATDHGRDLSGFKIENADQRSLAEIAAALTAAAEHIRQDLDPVFRRSRRLLQALPLWAVQPLLSLMSFVTNTLNWHLPHLGMPRDPFGSAMVTSVGMLGIDTGFAPFLPIARCPIILTVTRVKPRPWVVGDHVEPRPVLRLCGTFDHRFIDGSQAAVFSTEMETLLSHPRQMLTALEDAAWSGGP